jgi:glycosyltransferase involved in cell wall biosynthesis
MKTAAIYDRWLFTLGGGEQVAFSFAESLHILGYSVTLLTHKKINRKKAETKMGVDLSRFKIKYLPLKPTKEISQYTEKYDLFINNSYLDYFPNRSKNGYLSVFFPNQINLSILSYIKILLIIPTLKNFFIYPLMYEFFKYDEYVDGKLFKWLSNSSNIYFNNKVSKFSISLYSNPISFSEIDQLSFLINNNVVHPSSKNLNHKKNIITFHFEYFEHNDFVFTIKNKLIKQNFALIKLSIPSYRYYFYNIFKSLFPRYEMRLHGGPETSTRSEINSYKSIITISNFCNKWISNYWGLDSKVLYPSVKTDDFNSKVKKKNKIINVGRFFVTGHNKKQFEQIEVFKNLIDANNIKNWELHFIGSVHSGLNHQEYFDKCKKIAEGYPIFFHIDIPFSDLKLHLSNSKIYWHATGLDVNENASPILLEHFGITTVEAMASGCVPIVIDKGGQSEIVTKEAGLKWETREDWKKQTLRIIKDDKLRQKMSRAAIKRSKYFSKENFHKRFIKAFELD